MDLGSDTVSIGWAGDDAPNHIVKIREMCSLPQYEIKDPFGTDGRVRSWDMLERVLHHCLHDVLNVKPENHRILLTTAPLATPEDNERLMQIMFELWQSQAVVLRDPAVLSLYSAGRMTGLVLESGRHVTRAVPVKVYTEPPHLQAAGAPVPGAQEHGFAAGERITHHLRAELAERGHDLSMENVIALKESGRLTVALDPAAAGDGGGGGGDGGGGDGGGEFALPDGTVVTLGDTSAYTEPLFSPTAQGDPVRSGPHDLVFDAYRNVLANGNGDVPFSAEDLDHFRNVILTGTTTLFRGYPERLTRELRNGAGPIGGRDNTRKLPSFRVIAPPERRCSAWIGGSIIGSLTMTEWTTKESYDEAPWPQVHHRKRF